MGAEAETSQDIVRGYRKAREENDYPAQAGILFSLLRMMVMGDPDMTLVARSTALAIVRVWNETDCS